MKIYMAAVYTNNYRKGMTNYVKMDEFEQSIMDKLEYILESYHYVKDPRYVSLMQADNAKVFVDSGAFTAATLGAHLTVEEYCDYLKQNRNMIKVDEGIELFSVLDAIGDAKKTFANQKLMEKLGCKPLPCFHAGEDSRFLDYYIQNYEYITLGGMVGTSVKQLDIWLERIWSNHLLDEAGQPKIKVHGFGITSNYIMNKYPWFSCDSSSWLQAAAYGSIFTKEFGPIKVSEKSPSIKDKGQHFFTLTEPEKRVVLRLIKSNGFDPKVICRGDKYRTRVAYNVMAYSKLNSEIAYNRPKTTKIKSKELF